MRLSPRDPLMALSTKYLGDAELGLGHFDAAIDRYHKAIDLGMHNMWPYTSLAAANALAGQMEAAKTALAEARRLEPKLTSVKWLIPLAPPIPNLFDGLREAGLPEDPTAEPAHLSIVVLPFTNLSGDPAQDYFADGITENLTTDLSRLRGSFVIARNTAFTYKGKSIDAKEIGKELGVRYVLEGSVQRDTGRVRVNVQLIDAESGNHLWVDRFDKPASDLFQMQDEIVARLANQLGAELVPVEARRAERTPYPDSMDLYLQGQAWLNSGVNPENLAKARGFFERAVALDPKNLDALLGVGRIDYSLGGAFLSDDRDARLAAAEGTIAKVLSLRPNDALAHEIMGDILNQTKRSDQGIAELERALALDPNLAGAHADIGLAKILIGRPEETEAHEKEALRLSRRDSFASMWLHFIGGAKMSLGANEEAVALFRRSIEINRTNPLTHFFLAAALANLGKLEEAQSEVKAGLALDPGFSIHRFRSGGGGFGPLLEGLRKAGLPEE
jgi:TolB-like protein/Flp pilus assembly protein TadD